MRTSESIASIAPALLAAQKELENIPKSGINTFYKSPQHPNGYPHMTLDDILNACKKVLNKHGVIILQGGDGGNGEIINQCTRLLHSSGEWIEDSIALPIKSKDPQAAGSAITYARRYSLASMLGVASEEDDDGNMAAQATTKQPAKPASKATPKTEPVPTGGHVHDSRESHYARITIQKGRPAVKGWPEAKWEALLCNAFSIETKAQIAELSPMDLGAGIDKLIILIDEMEQEQVS